MPDGVDSGGPRARGNSTQPIFAWTFAGASIVVWILMVAHGASPWLATSAQLSEWGASSAANLFVEYQWWTLFTTAFVSAGNWHLAFSVAVLLIVGQELERTLGPERFLGVFFASAVAGSLTALAVHPGGVDAGASSAIFGLSAAAAASRWLAPQRTANWPKRVDYMLAIAAIGLVAFSFAPQIDNFANLGGALVGGLLGALFERFESDEPGRAFSPLIIIALLVFFAVGTPLALVRAGSSPPIQLAQLRREAVQAMQSNDPQGALPLIERSLAIDGRQVPMLDLRAEAYERLKDNPRCEEAATAALTVDPHDVNALSVRSSARLRMGKDDAALADCEEALLQPMADRHRSWLRTLEAEIYFHKRDYQSAFAAADTAFELASDNLPLRMLRAAAARRIERFDLAEADYRAAIEDAPDDAQGWSGLCAVLMERGAFEDAASACDRALAIAPDAVGSNIARSELYSRAGELDQAIAQLTHALKHTQDSSTLYNNRAWFERMQGKSAAAQADIARSLQLSPDDPPALGTACWVEMDRGRKTEALAYCKRAVALDPADPIDEGMVHFIEGDKAGALRLWSAELEKHPYLQADLKDYLARARN